MTRRATGRYAFPTAQRNAHNEPMFPASSRIISITAAIIAGACPLIPQAAAYPSREARIVGAFPVMHPAVADATKAPSNPNLRSRRGHRDAATTVAEKDLANRPPCPGSCWSEIAMITAAIAVPIVGRWHLPQPPANGRP